MSNFARPLDRNDIVESFLKNSLDLDYKNIPELNGIISKIVTGEIGVSNFEIEHETMYNRAMRHEDYRADDKRWKLRAQIIDQLWTKKRLDDDEKITMEDGGALPHTDVKFEKEVFIIIGSPASGKSGIANMICEDYGAVIMDSDYTKRKLPEYITTSYYGASIVHKESTKITFGFDPHANPNELKSLYNICLENKANMVIPMTGQNPIDIINITKNLIETHGYKVHLILVSLPKKDATIRAVYRYAETGRYVPLGLIFDKVGNDPSLCYYYLRSKHGNLFSSMGVLSTSARPASHVDAVNDSPVLKYEFNDVILRLP